MVQGRGTDWKDPIGLELTERETGTVDPVENVELELGQGQCIVVALGLGQGHCTVVALEQGH